MLFWYAMNILNKCRDSTVVLEARKALNKVLTPDAKCVLRELMYFKGKLLGYLKNGRWGLFSNVSVETTTKCNRACGYCPHSDRELRQAKCGTSSLGGGRDMDIMSFMSILHQLSELDFRGKVALQGYGEPLLDKDLANKVKTVRGYLPDAYISINSNGDALKTLSIEELRTRLMELFNAGLDHIYITEHSVNSHERAAMKEKIRVLKASAPELGKKVSYWTGLSKLRNRGGAVPAKNFRGYQEKGFVSGADDRDFCRTVVNTMDFAVDGSVSVCCDDYTGSSVVGKIDANQCDLDEKGRTQIENIWFSKEFVQIRDNIRKRVLDGIPCCEKCNVGLGR